MEEGGEFNPKVLNCLKLIVSLPRGKWYIFGLKGHRSASVETRSVLLSEGWCFSDADFTLLLLFSR